MRRRVPAPSGPIAPPVSIPTKECFSEFLPTSDYAPAALHFRLTARDLHPAGGGNSSADLTLTLADNAGPFLVTSPNSGVTYPGGSVADGHLGQGQHRHSSDQHVEREDQPLDGRRPHVPASCSRPSTANDGSRGRDDPERADDYRSREDRGRRQRLLRRLERELHDHHWWAAATASASTSTAASTTAASAASTAATTATATATAASTTTTAAGALPSAERDRPDARSGPGTNPGTALPRRQSAPSPLETGWPGRPSDPARRRGACSQLQGEPGGRQEVIGASDRARGRATRRRRRRVSRRSRFPPDRGRRAAAAP